MAAEMFEFGPAGSGLSRDAGAALHAQISNAIRLRIVSGEWPRDHRLAPEPQLAAEIGVSRGTLRRALGTLIDEGLLRQIPGRGTFVTQTLMEPAAAQRLSTLSEDFAAQGIELDTVVMSCTVVEPPFEIAKLLRMRPGTLAMCLIRVRSAEQLPIALMHNYVPLELAPGIESVDFSRDTLFGALEGRFGLEIGTARRSFSAVTAPLQVAQQLALPPGQPVQYLEQLTLLADGRPVEYSDVWIDSRQLRVVTHMSRRTSSVQLSQETELSA
ncbi:MAG: GntR family transcriptional regulator [Pseudolysinimonas sp.]